MWIKCANISVIEQESNGFWFHSGQAVKVDLGLWRLRPGIFGVNLDGKVTPVVVLDQDCTIVVRCGYEIGAVVDQNGVDKFCLPRSFALGHQPFQYASLLFVACKCTFVQEREEVGFYRFGLECAQYVI